jgi:phosphoribosylformylglycinamidine cyclo-ligase
MIHCSGGAQTKILHFTENKRITKNKLFPIPPLFRIIQEQSGTEWKEMYKVFNMGHRMEIYAPPAAASEIIQISKSFGVDAQVVGFVEEAGKNELIIESETGRFTY